VKVTTYFCAKGASDAIEFYKRAFGAEERYRIPNPDGTLGHAEITIGDTLLMLSDEWPRGNVYSPKTLNGSSVSFVVDVDDVDGAFQRALDAGATVERPIRDEPFGRGGWLVDPFGHRWNIMKPNPNFNPEDMQ
jgi:PhnB protein